MTILMLQNLGTAWGTNAAAPSNGGRLLLLGVGCWLLFMLVF